jgi:hypothetical protein
MHWRSFFFSSNNELLRGRMPMAINKAGCTRTKRATFYLFISTSFSCWNEWFCCCAVLIKWGTHAISIFSLTLHSLRKSKHCGKIDCGVDDRSDERIGSSRSNYHGLCFGLDGNPNTLFIPISAASLLRDFLRVLYSSPFLGHLRTPRQSIHVFISACRCVDFRDRTIWVCHKGHVR